MGFYSRFILPRVIDLTCGFEPMQRQRERVVPHATGTVLEIGIGSGLNLPHYNAGSVDRVIGIDPSAEILQLARRRARLAPIEVELIEAGAHVLPLDAGSVDTVVVTFALCTIPDPVLAAAEMRRVLRADGRLLFCEHGEAPDERVRRWQRRMNPVWNLFGGGCHLDRPIPALLAEGGLVRQDVESGYVPGWRPSSYHYWGSARPA